MSREGSIDWLCWPRFDSGACFAALLGGPEQGRWLLTPADTSARIKRRYRDDTLILETDFETAQGGCVTLIDFMPRAIRASSVIRLVVGKRGQVAMRMELIVRFDYGSLVPWVTRVERRRLRRRGTGQRGLAHAGVVTGRGPEDGGRIYGRSG